MTTAVIIFLLFVLLFVLYLSVRPTLKRRRLEKFRIRFDERKKRQIEYLQTITDITEVKKMRDETLMRWDQMRLPIDCGLYDIQPTKEDRMETAYMHDLYRESLKHLCYLEEN